MHLTKCGSLMQIWSVANHLKGTHGLPGTVTVMPARIIGRKLHTMGQQLPRSCNSR